MRRTFDMVPNVRRGSWAHSYLTAAIILLSGVRVADAQSPESSVAAAERDGATFRRSRPDVSTQASLATRPFAGTTQRKCVDAASAYNIGGLRSGDIVARGRFGVQAGLRAARASKILWLPLHGRADQLDTPLLLRTVRLGQPPDSTRQTVARLVRSHGEVGYPSSVIFPASGEWLLIATAGDDWGCFVLTVAE
jgi:hypothetical protein